MKILSIVLICICFACNNESPENYMKGSKKSDEIPADSYQSKEVYEVAKFVENHTADKPKNIILMIGDGMGVSQIYAGLTANRGNLFLGNFKKIGFQKTHSSDNYVTDSAAGGTAMSSGEKTYNGAIAVNPDKEPVKTILEMAEENGLATGLASTSSITHATPASFISHQPSRKMYEEIAADFLKTDIDVFIGGGYEHFSERKDGRDLISELKENGYQVLQDLEEISKVNSGKLAGLTAPGHNGRLSERGNLLPVATKTALKILNKDDDGFFLMIEGSQIDWGGHDNRTAYIVEEMLDFDMCIGEALKFASEDNETLVIVTADHETGGMTLNSGDINTGLVGAKFTTGHHTGVMVPVFAFGPGSEEFTGIMENTDIAKKMIELFGF